MSDKSPQEDNTKVSPVINVLSHMHTLISILQRTPDLNVALNDVLNLFFMVMPMFKNKEFFKGMLELWFNEDTPENKSCILSFKILMIRYKDQFEYENVELLAEEEFNIALINGLVLREDYETFTGKKRPHIPENLNKHNIPTNLQNINFNDIDSSKTKVLNVDFSNIDTVDLDNPDIKSDLISTAINEELLKKR